MAALNWGVIQDGGTFESLMQAILYAEDSGTILFGRPGKDSGQDARSSDGSVVYQAKYRQGMTMDEATKVALEELEKIKKYRQSTHANFRHWQNARQWVLVANIQTNPNDNADWHSTVVPKFQAENLEATYWSIDVLNGKLADYSQVRSVFFEGETRVFVSLKEARDQLANECIGAKSFEKQIVGREVEMQGIKDFIASNNRILPVIGGPGIGKSRLVYEALIGIGENGWRVLWALTDSMARSSHWFHLLNGNQPTCVAIDDPDDPYLLKAVIEQLGTVERRSWKIIVCCRSGNADTLRRFHGMPMLANDLEVMALNEDQSKQLLALNCTANAFSAADVFTIFKHTGGVPGWLCLVAELANRNALEALTNSVEGFASLYVENALARIGGERQQDGLELLRYLSLWRTVALDSEGLDGSQARFLAQKFGKSNLQHLLKQFTSLAIIRNWGFRKRLYSVQPMIVREHILSSWLFDRNEQLYTVNPVGKSVIDLLIRGAVPGVPSALRSVAHLSRSRLESGQSYSFLKPIFDELISVASTGTVVNQNQLVSLVQILGPADPESALDCIVAIRENDKDPVEVSDSIWGKVAFTRAFVLGQLPWLLFQIAAYVPDAIAAGRYLEEFRKLLALEKVFRDEIESGKDSQKLLQRLLCENKHSEVFAGPAQEIVLQEIEKAESWPFVGILLECLIKPEREYTEWTAQWTLTFRRRTFVPNGLEWKAASMLRKMAFGLLKPNVDSAIRLRLWRVLSESHHQYHRLLLNEGTKDILAEEYRSLLLDDLRACATILEARQTELSVEETVAARTFWSWYLEHGNDNELCTLSEICEQACVNFSQWHLQDFFRFDTPEALTSETERVAAMLCAAPDTQHLVNFFDATKTYLDAARSGGQDMADSFRINDLADRLFDQFDRESIAPGRDSQVPVYAYVNQVLLQPDASNKFGWWFALRICQRHMLRIKTNGDSNRVVTEISEMIRNCPKKGRLLLGLFSNPHPLNTGELSGEEFKYLVENQCEFSNREWFVLLGAFAPVHWIEVQPYLEKSYLFVCHEVPENDDCMAIFVRMAQLSALRFNCRDLKPLIEWVLQTIISNELDGALLDMHELKWFRQQSGFLLTTPQLLALFSARILLESKAKPKESFRVLPFDFKVGEWCQFDPEKEHEGDAFKGLCDLALGNSYIGLYWMPKFIAQLDPSGLAVSTFVKNHLAENPSISAEALARLAYLASAYSDSSNAWAQISMPICSKSKGLSRRDRETVFFGLSKKETGVLTSALGEVPDYYVRQRDEAARLLRAELIGSPLTGYREWKSRHAEDALSQAKGMAEEESHA